jgi:hypothetical protein
VLRCCSCAVVLQLCCGVAVVLWVTARSISLSVYLFALKFSFMFEALVECS